MKGNIAFLIILGLSHLRR